MITCKVAFDSNFEKHLQKLIKALTGHHPPILPSSASALPSAHSAAAHSAASRAAAAAL